MKMTHKEIVSYCISKVTMEHVDFNDKEQRKNFQNIAYTATNLVQYLIDNGFLKDSKELHDALYDYFEIAYLQKYAELD